MKNKGFTLVELLAVIVVLAIISLIAVPMILGVIEDSKQNAAKLSVLGYVDAVEKQIMINEVDSSMDDIVDGTYSVLEDGSISDGEHTYSIELKGKTPEEGTITVLGGKIVGYDIILDGYTISYEQKEVYNINGLLKDSENNPLPNTVVVIYSTRHVVITNEKGEFTINDLEVGNHKIYIMVDGTTVDEAKEMSDDEIESASVDSLEFKTGTKKLTFGKTGIIAILNKDGEILSSDATLKSLEVEGYSLSPLFNPEILEYAVTTEESNINIKAEKNNMFATVTGTGNKEMELGNNYEYIIEVTAEDGIKKEYKINIVNQKPVAPVIEGEGTYNNIDGKISISTPGSALSGIKEYEYYKTSTTTAPSSSTVATGTTDNELVVENNGTKGIYYIYYRTVSNKGNKSDWSNKQTVKVIKAELLSTKILSNTIASDTPNLKAVYTGAGKLYKSTLTNSGEPTYYFRGNVTNNYVSFAGFTWRIVRLNEDGTIRLILQDGINNKTRYYFNSKSGTSTDLSTIKSHMYYSNSDLKTQLNTWYTNNIKNKGYIDRISSGNYFCEQARVASSTTGTNTSLNGTEIKLYSNYSPTFKCFSDGNGKGLVNASIGLLTYDEVVFAGGYFNAANQSYYLYIPENAYNNSYGWWTISTGGVSNITSTSKKPVTAWVVSAAGLLFSVNSKSTYILRPVINLKADTLVIGTGTSGDKYVVQ